MQSVGLCAVLLAALAMARAVPISESPLRFDHYSVYKLRVESRVQLSVITKLGESTQRYNIWKDYDSNSKEIHIMVDPSERKHFKQLLKIFQINNELMIENVQQLIDAEQFVASTDSVASFGWTRYYELSEIEAWLDSVLAAYPEVTKPFIVGSSYEGRSIRGIKISHKAGNPGIFIESNIHAREWITSASATWFINELLTSQDAQMRNLAENYDWHIVPVFNVDGFEYSHRKNRMWRKTRQPHSTSDCIGVDANRNYDSYWMANNGASDNPCSELFAGDKAWSEPETKALSDYLTSIKDQFNIYISFHSYGQYLLSPYGHSTDFPDNYSDLLAIGAAFTQAIRSLPYETEYTHGSTTSVLYVASGTSVDWVFNELDKKVGFTIEYRDTGRYGFILPPVQIVPNCEELRAGMIALIAKTKELGYL